MFDLHRFKALIFISLFFVSAPLWGQRFKGNYNFLRLNPKPYYFGINLGSNSSIYKPFRSKDFLLSDSIRLVESLKGSGMNIGLVTNLKIGDYFDFRMLPTISFAERNINYAKNSRLNPTSQRKVSSVFVEFPFQMRYKSAPYQDKRLFVVAGMKYAYDVASDARTKQSESLVKIAPHDFSVEYGAGIQFFLPYFIFSPEFKFSQGIGNTLIYNPNLPESTVLDKVLSRTFTISLFFEG